MKKKEKKGGGEVFVRVPCLFVGSWVACSSTEPFYFGEAGAAIIGRKVLVPIELSSGFGTF